MRLDAIKVHGELTPELLKIKANYENELDTELDMIEHDAGLPWTEKQKRSAELQRSYEAAWEDCLTDAGYVVEPMFESVGKETFTDWFDELNKINK